MEASERVAAPDRYTAAPFGRRLHAAGLRLWVAEDGPEDGPPVILVHGLGSHGGVWRRIVPGLAARGLRVLVPDLPGHGLSDGKRHRGTYSPRFFARVILALADALGLDGLVVAGNSLGGAVAARAALVAPGRVRRLVLIDSAGLDPNPVPWRTRLMYLPLAAPLALGLTPSPLWMRMFVERAVVADPAQAGELTLVMAAHPPLPGALRRSATALLQADASVYAELPKLACPTLLLWGELDVQFPVAIAEAALARIPHARLVRVAGAGHVPQWETPDPVVSLIGAFLGTATPAPPARAATGTATAPLPRLRPRRPIARPVRPHGAPSDR